MKTKEEIQQKIKEISDEFKLYPQRTYSEKKLVEAKISLLEWILEEEKTIQYVVKSKITYHPDKYFKKYDSELEQAFWAENIHKAKKFSSLERAKSHIKLIWGKIPEHFLFEEYDS